MGAADGLGADFGKADMPDQPAFTMSAMAPIVSSIGTSGSSRAGR